MEGSVERRVPYQKAAIRSSAFARALLYAGSIAADPEGLVLACGLIAGVRF